MTAPVAQAAAVAPRKGESVQAVNVLTGQPSEVSREVLNSLPKEKEIAYGKPVVVSAANDSRWIKSGESKKVTAQFFIPSDGDTARVVNPGNPSDSLVCRFTGVDAPETSHGKGKPGQPYGEDSLKNLQRLVANKEVQVTVRGGVDKYGRSVCDISVEGKDINLEQIKGGFAWLYEQYAPPEVKEQYKAAQSNAMKNGLGLWAGQDPVYPPTWRKTRWSK